MQTDGNPCPGMNDEYISYLIYEHVILHPIDDNPPLEEDRLTATIVECNPFTSPCDCGNSTPCNSQGGGCRQLSSFQTPPSHRYENGQSVNTMYYWFIVEAKWNCTRGNNLHFSLLEGSKGSCIPIEVYFIEDNHPMNATGYYKFTSPNLTNIPGSSSVLTRSGSDELN